MVTGCTLDGADGGAATDPATDATAGDAAADGTPAVATARSVRLVDHDVEAPKDFQTTDKALWDGRPSLGGVWVAAPSVTDPMRVIMRNPSNGKFVIGALFRREADNPGPKLQISSDAADALGMIAGQPATLNVTALRREEVPATTPDATRPLLDSSETVQASALPPVAAATADPGGPGQTGQWRETGDPTRSRRRCCGGPCYCCPNTRCPCPAGHWRQNHPSRHLLGRGQRQSRRGYPEEDRHCCTDQQGNQPRQGLVERYRPWRRRHAGQDQGCRLQGRLYPETLKGPHL